MHIQSKLLLHTPVMGTHTSYQLGCVYFSSCSNPVRDYDMRIDKRILICYAQLLNVRFQKLKF